MKNTKSVHNARSASAETVTCYINPKWEEMGHARVAVAREKKGKFAAAIFLVDLYCLGVKDVMGKIDSRRIFHRFLPGIYFDGDPIVIPFDLAREIVWGGVGYAHSLSFDPHPEFEDEKFLLGEEVVPRKDITFGGPDGKPLYVVGPQDQAEEIVQALEEQLGKNGFDIVYPDEF